MTTSVTKIKYVMYQRWSQTFNKGVGFFFLFFTKKKSDFKAICFKKNQKIPKIPPGSAYVYNVQDYFVLLNNNAVHSIISYVRVSILLTCGKH